MTNIPLEEQLKEQQAACAHYAELLLQWAKFMDSPSWNSEVDRQRFYQDCKDFLWNRKFDHLQWLKEQRASAVAAATPGIVQKCIDIVKAHGDPVTVEEELIALKVGQP